MKSVCSYTCGYCKLSREYDKQVSIKKDIKFISKNKKTTILKKPKVREKFKTTLENSDKKTIDLVVSYSSKSLQTTKSTKTLKQMIVVSSKIIKFQPTKTILNRKLISPTKSRNSILYQTALEKEKNTISDTKNSSKPVNHSNYSKFNNLKRYKSPVIYAISSSTNTDKPTATMKIADRKTSIYQSAHIFPSARLENRTKITSLSKTVKPTANVAIPESKTITSILMVNPKTLKDKKPSIDQSVHILPSTKRVTNSTSLALKAISKNRASTNFREINYKKQIKEATIQSDKSKNLFSFFIFYSLN